MTTTEAIAKLHSQKLIHLSTTGRKSGKPHSVDLWFAIHKGTVYLSHEGKETDWMKNLLKNQHVSFEVGGKTFTGNASYLKAGTEEVWAGKLALYEKYYGKASREVIEAWFSLSKLLKIRPDSDLSKPKY